MAEPNSNGQGGPRIPGWAVPIVASLIGMLMGGAVVWGRTQAAIDDFSDDLTRIEQATREKLDGVALANGERLTALSLRLNSQEEAIREASVAGARQEERLVTLGNTIEQRGKQRDDQLAEIRSRLDDIEASQNEDRIRAARMEAQLERLVDHLLPPPVIPSRPDARR